MSYLLVVILVVVGAPAFAGEKPHEPRCQFQKLVRGILGERAKLDGPPGPPLYWVENELGLHPEQQAEIEQVFRTTDALLGFMARPPEIVVEAVQVEEDPYHEYIPGKGSQIGIGYWFAYFKTTQSKTGPPEMQPYLRQPPAKEMWIHEYAHTYFLERYRAVREANIDRAAPENLKEAFDVAFDAINEVFADLVPTLQTGNRDAVAQHLASPSNREDFRKMVLARKFSRRSNHPWKLEDHHEFLTEVRKELGRHMPREISAMKDRRFFVERFVKILDAEFATWPHQPIEYFQKGPLTASLVARIRAGI